MGFSVLLWGFRLIMGFQAYYGVSGLWGFRLIMWSQAFYGVSGLWGSGLIMGSQVDTLSNNQNTVSGY